MPAQFIKIVGARQHNLKNLTIEIPREALVVITGLSGSGKSSLAFDTLYAEGQRKYVESLSAYARQFLDQMQKPEVDFIEGLSPAIAIEQRGSAANPRSTIATTTEIYDYLRLLFSSVGQPHDPGTGQPVFKHSTQQIVDRVEAYPAETKIMVLAPMVSGQTGEFRDVLEKIKREGFVRARIDGEMVEIGRPEPIRLEKSKRHTIEVVVDRLIIREGVRTRLADSLETALKWGHGKIVVLRQAPEGQEKWEEAKYSTEFSNPDTGFTMAKLTPKHFSFNSHLGACPACHGLGTESFFDCELMVPDPEKPLTDGAVAPWQRTSKRMRHFYAGILAALAKRYGGKLDAPYAAQPAEFKEALCEGTGGAPLEIVWGEGPKATRAERPFEGLVAQMQNLYNETESELTRNRLRQYMSRRECSVCHGARLRPEILAVTVRRQGGREVSIRQLCELTVTDARDFLEHLDLTAQQQTIVAEVLREILARLGFLAEVGLGYLDLDRESGTLSGGEAQRIRLATQIGSGLAGVLYVLDEPSIGLHQRDNDRLIQTLFRLRDLGNSVIVVEHDEDTIRAADFLLDLGPGAGVRGGEIIAQGTVEEVLACQRSLTAQYLTGELRIPVPKKRVTPGDWLRVEGASENNLENVTASFPIGCLTCVTGVSGSGKSTLVDDILRRALFRHFYRAKDRPGAHKAIRGLEFVDKAIVIDQSPIGRTPRSNPVTYTGAFGPIRQLFAGLPASRVRGYDSGRFSFNVKGGRCENCEGEGMIRIEMHFLADVYVECEVCHGRRYNRETLEITYKGRNIADILDMTVDEASRFFRNVPTISDRLVALEDVGLGYVRLGQSGTTLSGGEAQRIKMAAELAKKATGRTVYILDEPTTGLHFADIHKLLEVLMKLRDAGNTLIVIEHNLEVVKSADWVVDLGPGGGCEGGRIVAAGTPEHVAGVEKSHTGRYLRRYVNAALVLCFLFLLPALFAAQEPPLDEARHALADHLPSVAIEKLHALLAAPGLDDSTRGEAERELTHAILASGDAKGALARLDYPATPEERLWKAEALSSLGQWEEAKPLYEEVAQDGPGELREPATLGAAEAARLLGRPGEAAKILKKLDAQAPSNLVRLRLAELKVDGRDIRGAQQLLDDVFPWNATETKWRQYLQGRIDLAQGQAAPALELFETLLKDPRGLTPSLQAGATVGMTEGRVVLNGLEVADNVLEDFIWHNADSPYLEEMFRRLDVIYSAEDSPSESELQHWSSRPPPRRAALGLYYAARLEQRVHRQEKAIHTYTAFVQRYPQHAFAFDAWLQLGQLYLEANRVALAVSSFEGAMRHSENPDDRARAEAETGNAYFAEGEYLLAAQTFRDSAQRSADLWLQDTYDAALAWLHLGKYDEFLKDYGALSEHYPESEQRRELLLEEGLLQARSGNASAEQTLELFIRDFPDNARVPEARLALAELALARGNADESSQLLKVAYESGPSGDTVEHADYLAIFAADSAKDRDDAKVLELGRKFLEKYPASLLKPQVRMKLGQVYFRAEDFANAETQFEALAEETPSDPLAEKALILAGESAVRTMNAGGAEHALELFDRVAKGSGPLKLYARQEQALLEARLGKNKDAVIIYDEILRSSPDSELRIASLCGKADCLVAGALETNAPSPAAIALYEQIAADPDATAAWRDQALYKKAKCLDRAGSADAALAALYDVLNTHGAATSVGHKEPDFFWVEKAGFDAAAMLEAKAEWKGAISILEKLSQAGGPGAEESKRRAEQIRLEHFVWD